MISRAESPTYANIRQCPMKKETFKSSPVGAGIIFLSKISNLLREINKNYYRTYISLILCDYKRETLIFRTIIHLSF